MSDNKLDTKLDGILLHYALSDRKYMLEMVKVIKQEYFAPPLQIFYGILVKNFTDPAIKDILSKTALLDFCQNNGLTEQAIKCGQIYDKAMGLVLEGTGKPPDPHDFKYYIKKIKDRYNFQILQSAAQRIKSAIDTHEPCTDINKLFEHAVTDIHTVNRIDVIDEGTVGQDAKNMRDEYFAIKNNPEAYRGVTVGFPSLDSITNGFNGSELIVVAGMSGTGKSLLMMNFAINAWLGSNTPASTTIVPNGHNVIYFSLEMPRSNKGRINTGGYFNKRVLSCISELQLSNIRKGLLSPDEEERLQLTCDFMERYDEHKKLYVVDIPRGATPEDIEVKYLECKEKMDSVDMVVVDYLGIMAGLNPDNDDWKEIGQIAASLHELGRLYDFPVITASQMNRPQGTSQSLSTQKYNNLRIARGSGVVDNANIVMQIACRDDEDGRPDMPIILTKVRDGAKGELIFTKAFDRMRVYDGNPLTPSDSEVFAEFE